jgi:hypothetical protein
MAKAAEASALDLEFADINLILCLFCSIKFILQVLDLEPEFGLVVDDSFRLKPCTF